MSIPTRQEIAQAIDESYTERDPRLSASKAADAVLALIAKHQQAAPRVDEPCAYEYPDGTICRAIRKFHGTRLGYVAPPPQGHFFTPPSAPVAPPPSEALRKMQEARGAYYSALREGQAKKLVALLAFMDATIEAVARLEKKL